MVLQIKNLFVTLYQFFMVLDLRLKNICRDDKYFFIFIHMPTQLQIPSSHSILDMWK